MNLGEGCKISTREKRVKYCYSDPIRKALILLFSLSTLAGDVLDINQIILIFISHSHREFSIAASKV